MGTVKQVDRTEKMSDALAAEHFGPIHLVRGWLPSAYQEQTGHLGPGPHILQWCHAFEGCLPSPWLS